MSRLLHMHYMYVPSLVSRECWDARNLARAWGRPMIVAEAQPADLMFVRNLQLTHRPELCMSSAAREPPSGYRSFLRRKNPPYVVITHSGFPRA